MSYKVPTLKELSTEELKQLIECPKSIKKHAKKRMIIENASERNDMALESIDGIYDEPQEFLVFIRRSCMFPEDFSVGLIWKSKENGGVTLLRYNGKHGQNRSVPHQRVPHIHRLIEADIMRENYNPHQATMTQKYSTMEEAIPLFMEECHVLNWEKDFPELRELNLFSDYDWGEK